MCVCVCVSACKEAGGEKGEQTLVRKEKHVFCDLCSKSTFIHNEEYIEEKTSEK